MTPTITAAMSRRSIQFRHRWHDAPASGSIDLSMSTANRIRTASLHHLKRRAAVKPLGAAYPDASAINVP
jgi:hypothetical protein